MISTFNQLWHQIHNLICTHLANASQSRAALCRAGDLIELERLQQFP